MEFSGLDKAFGEEPKGDLKKHVDKVKPLLKKSDLSIRIAIIKALPHPIKYPVKAALTKVWTKSAHNVSNELTNCIDIKLGEGRMTIGILRPIVITSQANKIHTPKKIGTAMKKSFLKIGAIFFSCVIFSTASQP